MFEALSMYEARTIPASQGNHKMSKELGMICPFEECRESVFWVQSHVKNGTFCSAYWSHYPKSLNSRYCENKALTKSGREALAKLRPQAAKQRLALFNRRFWEIYTFEKAVPRNLSQAVLNANVVGFTSLNEIVDHCWERWNVQEILKHLPETIKACNNPELLLKEAKKHLNFDNPVVVDLWQEVQNELIVVDYSPLRYKILCEVIGWLGTRTAKPSYSKVLLLAFLDCLKCSNGVIHSNAVANMAINTLIMTDWERAIASIKDQTRGIGFS